MIFLSGIVPSIMFMIALMSGYSIILALIFVIVMAMLMMIITVIMIRHPLTSLIEGKGFLTMCLDSTGYIETFIVAPNLPFISGMFHKKKVESMFNRDDVTYLVPPRKAGLAEATMIDATGKIIGKRKVLIMPTEIEKPDYLFSFGNYPTFIYNKVLETFLPKSLFSDFEHNTFVKHAVMYLCKKTEELSASVRDFARYIVEQIRPHKSFWQSKWLIYIIIAIAVVVLIALFAPQIMNTLQGTKLPAMPSGGVVTP
ncbi:MAG: hypothetical protein MUP17_05040 [candidate division Zixibacteria bacterium]|nr:hypothetical protein [candidate division Zixibacteria bacterium]